MYTDHFGLTQSPFTSSPDPRFFYANATYQKAFTELRYGVKLRKGLMVLTGHSGTGKTTLMKLLASRFESHIAAARIEAPGDFAELLQRALVEFGLPCSPQERASLIRRFKGFLTEQSGHDRIAALLIDDAHLYDDRALTEIGRLSTLKADGHCLVQIILAGHPDLERRLREPRLQPIHRRVALWSALVPLAHNEVRAYIAHRLGQCGRQDWPLLFHPAAVEEIAAASGGVPGAINTICDRALSAAFHAGARAVSPEMARAIAREIQLSAEATEHGAPRARRDQAPTARPTEEKARSGMEREAPGRVEPAAARSPDEFIAGVIRRRARRRRRRRWELTGATLLAAAAVAVLVFYFANRSWRASSEESPISQTLGAHEPGLASAPLALDAASEARSSNPTKSKADVWRLPANTEKAPPDSEPRSDRASGRAPAVPRARPSAQVRIYTQGAEERDRALLDEIREVLVENGYSARDARLARGFTRGDVRFFFPQDRTEAERIKTLIETELSRRGVALSLEMLERDGSKFELAVPGNIEVWLPPLEKSG
ncbi:MAG TPA: AAA family ATPase [Candidatus Eisenbacteria bacterium]|nr:AAA family ATPase [Candidatus Eisenbacteria bacterium]